MRTLLALCLCGIGVASLAGASVPTNYSGMAFVADLIAKPVAKSNLSAHRGASGQGGATNSASGTQPAKSSSIDFGYTHDYTHGSKDQFYYKLTYLGNKLMENGAKPQLASVGSTYLKDPSEVDGADLKLSIADGIGGLSGPFGDAIGLHPFDALGGLFKFFHGKIEVSAKLQDNQQYDAGLGLESINVIPFVPLVRDVPYVTKTLRIGVLGDKQSLKSSSGTTTSTDSLEFTYRAYAAWGFDYTETQATYDMRDAILKRVDGLTQSDVDALKTSKDATDPLVVTALFSGTTTQEDPRHPSPHPSGLRDFYSQDLATIKQKLHTNLPFYADQRVQPRLNLEFRGEGSYAPVNFEQRRYNALYSFGANLWLDPRRPDVGKISLTYQHGYARGSLLESLDGLIVTFGFQFK